MPVLKGIHNGVKNTIDNYSYFTIRTGTTNAGKQLATMTSDEEQLSSFLIKQCYRCLENWPRRTEAPKNRLATATEFAHARYEKSTKKIT